MRKSSLKLALLAVANGHQAALSLGPVQGVMSTEQIGMDGREHQMR